MLQGELGTTVISKDEKLQSPPGKKNGAPIPGLNSFRIEIGVYQNRGPLIFGNSQIVRRVGLPGRGWGGARLLSGRRRTPRLDLLGQRGLEAAASRLCIGVRKEI